MDLLGHYIVVKILLPKKILFFFKEYFYNYFRFNNTKIINFWNKIKKEFFLIVQATIQFPKYLLPSKF